MTGATIEIRDRDAAVDWAACEAEYEREMAEEALLRELAESEAEERAMDGYYRDKYG